MKQKNLSPLRNALRHKVPPIPLFRSDLEEIFAIAETRNFDIQISDDRYEYEDLDDLKANRGDRVKNITITLRRENKIPLYMQIEVESDGVKLYSTKNDEMIAAWHEIKEIIDNRVPWYAAIMRPIYWLWGTAIVLWIFPNEKISEENMDWPVVIWLVSILLLSAMSLSSFLYFRKNRGVYLQRQHEVQGFWSRYGERILFLVLGTLLGIFGKVASDMLSGQ